jgi:hypothetical protein
MRNENIFAIKGRRARKECLDTADFSLPLSGLGYLPFKSHLDSIESWRWG